MFMNDYQTAARHTAMGSSLDHFDRAARKVIKGEGDNR